MSVDLAWSYFKHMECCKTALLSLALHVVDSSTNEKKDEKFDSGYTRGGGCSPRKSTELPHCDCKQGASK